MIEVSLAVHAVQVVDESGLVGAEHFDFRCAASQKAREYFNRSQNPVSPPSLKRSPMATVSLQEWGQSHFNNIGAVVGRYIVGGMAQHRDKIL